ncbi:MAG TPA: hypothetical protein ENG20_01680 [Methanomicrobia archaeon]|nr:hypothetical protein [Methanomicrobia archaeon]
MDLYEKLSLGLIVCFTVLMAVNWDNLPTAEMDAPYHLLMGKMYADYDRVVLWDYYEYAPLGRPQLYPPFLHVLIWWIHDLTGTEYWTIGKLFSFVQYPVALLSLWYFTRSLFGSRVALASLSVLASNRMFWWWEGSLAPTALDLAIFPLFLLFFYRKRFWPSVALLTIFLYSHLGIPYVFILGTGLFALFRREYRVFFIKVLSLSLLLFSPWLIHVLLNMEWISAHNPSKFFFLIFLNFNPLTVIFLFIGFYLLIKKFSDARYALIIATFLSFLPIIYMYGMRYSMHSPIINCVVFGIGITYFFSEIGSKIGKKYANIVFAVFLIVIIVVSPTVSFIPQRSHRNAQKAPQKQRIVFQTPFLSMIAGLNGERPKGIWQMNPEEMQELIDWIMENTSENEILHVAAGNLACYITLMTGRVTDSGMYHEVGSEEMYREISQERKSGIFIFDINFFRKGIPHNLNILARCGSIVVASVEFRPTKMPLRIKDVFIYVGKDLMLLEEIKDRNIYIGVDQSVITSIKDVKKLSVLVVNEDQLQKDLRNLRYRPEVLRLVTYSGKIRIDTLKEAKKHCRELELGVIGPNIVSYRKDLIEMIDRVVRHTPPDMEFINKVIPEEKKDVGDKYWVQIDISMRKIGVEEVTALINASQRHVGDRIIIEARDPKILSELLKHKV